MGAAAAVRARVSVRVSVWVNRELSLDPGLGQTATVSSGPTQYTHQTRDAVEAVVIEAWMTEPPGTTPQVTHISMPRSTYRNPRHVQVGSGSGSRLQAFPWPLHGGLWMTCRCTFHTDTLQRRLRLRVSLGFRRSLSLRLRVRFSIRARLRLRARLRPRVGFHID